jgi:hypothetical protein
MKIKLQLLISAFLVIGIFSISQNYIYSQTTHEENKVELLTQKMELANSSGKFIGQVINMGNKTVEYVTIIATFYDATGEMIGSKPTYSKPSSLKPNMTAVYEMFLDDDISNNIASYDVTITWRYPGESEKYSNVYGLNQ